MTHVRKLSFWALLATHLGLAGSAWSFGPLYLRGGGLLDIAAPVATMPRDDVSASIGAGRREVLAEFQSSPVVERVEAGTATARLYLVTGKAGMEGCAVVIAELSRRSPRGERTG